MYDLKGYILSLDPAQVQDYAALSVLEVSRTGDQKRNIYKILALDRRQNLPYPEITAWSLKAYLNPRFRKDVTFQPVFVVDAGGVGRAVEDELHGAGIPARGITLTPGEKWSHEGKDLHCSKALLIGKFLGAWDQGRVLISSKASFFNPFKRELRAFRGEVNKLGRAKFEAEDGEYDDLIMSIAQAVWLGEQFIKPKKPFVVPPVAAFSSNDFENPGGAVGELLNSAWGRSLIEATDPVTQARLDEMERRGGM